MALPCSGPLSISQIHTALGSGSYSLRTLSAAAGFSTPDAISEFYCYNPSSPRTLYWTNQDYSYGDYINLFVAQNSSTVLVNDYAYYGDYHNGSTTIYTGDYINFSAEGFSGANVYLSLQVYDTNLGYLYNNTQGAMNPYLYGDFNVTSSNGTIYIDAYLDVL